MEKIIEYFKGDDLAASSWNNKYRLNNETIEEFFNRISSQFLDLDNFPERDPSHKNIDDLSEYGKKRYLMGRYERKSLMKTFFGSFDYIIPGGSALSGLGSKKPVSLSNCFVVASPDDTIESIFNTARNAAQIYKRRGGVGMDLSQLRPNGSFVDNAAKTSSGITSWMELYSKVTEVVGQNGRRGALMLSIDVNHPDSPNFTTIKQDLSKVTGANVSVKVNDAFRKAAENDEDYILRYPVDADISNIKFSSLELNKLTKIERSKLTCKDPIIYVKKVKAKELWDSIIHCAWQSAEPGILNWERILEYDPTSVYDKLRAVCTNPCGELPLGPYDSCRLIASNLYSIVANPFRENSYINEDLAYQLFYETQILADIFVDLELEAVDRILKKIDPNFDGDIENLDHVSDEFKLWRKVKEIGASGRRTGTGITAYADMLAAMFKNYGDPIITQKIFNLKLRAELDASIDLAILNGAFPLWDPKKEFEYGPSHSCGGLSTCDIKFKGKNSWYRMLVDEFPEQAQMMYKYGRRNAGLSTIAPTGTISMLTQTSSGCEPVFALYYTRRRKCNPGETASFIDDNGVGFVEYNVVHPKLQTWYDINSSNLSKVDLKTANKELLDTIIEQSPWYNNVSADIVPKDRVRTQAIMQKYITSSISSTVNLPSSATEEDIATIYNEAFNMGCKGMTVYRDGSRSGILVTDTTKPLKIGEFTHRPKTLDATLEVKTIKGRKYAIIIGFRNDKPYELFCYSDPIGVDGVIKGFITKEDSGLYSFDSEFYKINNIVEETRATEEGNIGLITSFGFRYGDMIPMQYIIKLIKKCYPGFNNLTTAITRSLKVFIEDGESDGEKCPECGEKLIFQSGCKNCTCGYSACS